MVGATGFEPVAPTSVYGGLVRVGGFWGQFGDSRGASPIANGRWPKEGGSPKSEVRSPKFEVRI